MTAPEDKLVGSLLRPDDPQLIYLEALRRSFPEFVRRAWPWITGGEDIAWNWHIRAIAYQLGLVAAGHNLRLIANLPPRHGKSKLISVIWVAWMLGRDPSRNFVCVSYSNELSGKLARDCLAIMQSPWYAEVFPETIVSSKRSASGDFETTAGGGRLATSVTGTLTGRGGDIIILDDVIKPDEANSETTRNAVNHWFKSTLASRLNDKASGAIILVMQRLHEDDLAGMLLRSGGWAHLKLPAIAPEDVDIRLSRKRVNHRRAGDVLHPERESQQILDAIKAEIGSAAFAAQYLQDPVPATGNIIKDAWFKIFVLATLILNRGFIVQSWDTASKDNPHNDYSVCVTALVIGKDIYILHVHRSRMQIPALVSKTIDLAREHQARVLLIEDHASGTQLIQTLLSQAPRNVPSPIPCRAESDKVSRALGVAAMIEAGRVHLPLDAPWLAEFKSEILGFPNGRFDDQVDALSQLLGWLRDRDQYYNTRPVVPLLNDDSDFPETAEGSQDGLGSVGESYFRGS